jgi:hypothetical protein
MTLTEIATLLLGGGNVFQFYLSWQSRKSTIKGNEADATAKIAALYTTLTEQMANENARTQKIIEEQNAKIEKLEILVLDYKKKCGNCKILNK